MAKKIIRKTEPATPTAHPIQQIALSDVNPAPYNPRKDLQPGDDEFERLRTSIRRFGHAQVLVWNNRTGHLVGGHQTLKVLLAEGYEHANAAVVDLDVEHEKALNLALNKISGDWEAIQLGRVLEDLLAGEIDATLSGFDNDEISEAIETMHRELEASIGSGEVSIEREAEQGPPASGFSVVAQCRDRAEQRKVMALLKKQGVKCRGMTETAD